MGRIPLVENSSSPEKIKLPPEQGVVVGQVWKDKDKRRERLIMISRVDGSRAYYEGGKIERSLTVERLKSRFTLL